MFYYLDSAPIIYLVEKVTPFYERASERLRKPNILLATYILSLWETRIKPLRENNQELPQQFEDFFNGKIILEIGISREIIERATELRAKYNFKTPDSIHLAAAITSSCEVFFTNDHRLDRCTEIKIETLE
ncbi:MAG: type II toxin-antitoxin system VapC family toxin [bacterium]